jgi:predicted metal-dependent enzyme (double-stranded beta helix superfamily)
MAEIKEKFCYLISHIDQLLEDTEGDDSIYLKQIEEALSKALQNLLVDPQDFPPHLDKYSRYLVHRDEEDRYSIYVMVWMPGQNTSIHNHGGLWCMEGLYCGELRMVEYFFNHLEGNQYSLNSQKVTVQNHPSFSCIIKPEQYHSISNPADNIAITVHIYGGFLDQCDILAPLGENNIYVSQHICLELTN